MECNTKEPLIPRKTFIVLDILSMSSKTIRTGTADNWSIVGLIWKVLC